MWWILLKEEIRKYFSEKFKEPKPVGPHLKGVEFMFLSESDNIMLEDCFINLEIKEAVWDWKAQRAHDLMIIILSL